MDKSKTRTHQSEGTEIVAWNAGWDAAIMGQPINPYAKYSGYVGAIMANAWRDGFVAAMQEKSGG